MPETTSADAQELEAAGIDYVTVQLTGYDGTSRDVRAVPAPRWRSSALRSLNGGDMDGFMELVVHPDDYEVYEDLDPDMEAVGRFAADVAGASGEALGKSSGPRRSSRSTRKK
ncbi:hypothetical protein H3146_07265 [Streptomyces sp. OF3]|uniref:Uncharacterized protein n=1 Tax=Streptomyces alkaliterrae TaxID=2213162 RepID=A0A7W3WIY0_9ACTN|nr:hypothetical protein [Streptomyces alkaliterrae]MBB1253169.1 hypothetical protein [Streptomyces alkaliterrae]